jgi:ABC-type branched-subunit amino acid transport system ATPase component
MGENEKKTVDVAFANEGKMRLQISDIAKWEPKKVSRMGHTTYFENDGTFVSMKTEDYNLVFGIR